MHCSCYFNNPGTESPLTFGKGSEQEMCIDFLYYYPYNANIKPYCTYHPGADFGGTYDGFTKITSADDNGMRAFGINVGTSDDPSCQGGATVEWMKPQTSTPSASDPLTPSASKPLVSSPTPISDGNLPVGTGQSDASVPIAVVSLYCIALVVLIVFAVL